MRTTVTRLALIVGVLLIGFQLSPIRAKLNALAAETGGLASTATSPYSQVVLGDSPQAYWRLDETSGTTFGDSTGNGHTGTLSSAVTLGAPGALSSDPTDSSVLFGPSTVKNHIVVTNTVGLDTSAGVTLEAWVNPISSAGVGPNILALNSTTFTGSYVLTVTTSGANTGLVTVRGGGPTQVFIVASAIGAATIGQWNHIVGTYDGTTLSLYLNGSLVASQAVSAVEGNPINIAVLGGANLQGNVDEVAVYGHALSAGQVLAHYNAAFSAATATPAPTLTATATATATPTNSSTPTATRVPYAQTIMGDTPQAYWRLDEASGTTLSDFTGNGNTGGVISAVTLNAPGGLASDPTDASVLLGDTTHNHILSTTTADLNTSGGVTLEAWVNPISSTGAGPNIVSINTTSNTGSYVITVATSGATAGMATMRAGVNTTQTGIVRSAVGAVPNGQWSYIVGTYDGTTLSLYLNGAFVASLPVSAPLGMTIQNAVLGGPSFQGNLDEVAVYGHALTASQVLAHYNAALITSSPTNTPAPTFTNTTTPVITLTATSTAVPTLGAMGWGKNVTGQVGDGTTVNRSVPVPVSNLTGVTVIGGGAFHSLAVKSDGSVWAWGNNTFGQVGNGTTSGLGNTGVFAPIQVLGVSSAVAVAGGGIQAGGQHSLALKNDGTVWSWGSNNFGQLGDGTINGRLTAVQASGLTGVTAIAAGGQHSLALKNDGTVWAFGLNASGQLGIGNTTNQATPVQISGLTGIVAIAAGGNHSLAVKNDGTAWAWGSNVDGQLGEGTTTQRNSPVQVSGLSGATALAGGNLFSLALKSDGTVWSWGDNRASELGNGQTVNSSTPVQVSGVTNVSGISAQANGNHGLALKGDGTMWGWGSNVFGQLGDGTNLTRGTPVQVTGFGTTVAAIAAGGSHSLALVGATSATSTVTSTATSTTTVTATATATTTGGGNPQTSTDATGQVETFSTTGSIVTTGAFFQNLGTNGRTCATCHIQADGWSITPQQALAVFTATQGLDPLFTPNDGTNSPNADVSTFQARHAASSMLLSKGDFRVGIGMPSNAEFTLTAINDPYGHATASELSLFRRPLPSTNLPFQSSVMWDGRETVETMLAANTSGQNLAALNVDLAHQSVDATNGHAQASVTPTDAQQQDIVAFEMALFTAQGTDTSATQLNALGATGGSQALASQPFAIGANDFSAPDFTPNAFTVFSAWDNLPGTDSVTLARQSIARGETLFNTRTFTMTGVNGLNDVLNQPTIVGTCTTCHNAPNLGSHSLDGEFNTAVSEETAGVDLAFPTYTFTNNTTLATITVTDPGLGLITGKWADIGKFKVPTLRGLASRAPYFHNGVGTTLIDVIHSYDLRFTIGFTHQEEFDIQNFLNAL